MMSFPLEKHLLRWLKWKFKNEIINDQLFTQPVEEEEDEEDEEEHEDDESSRDEAEDSDIDVDSFAANGPTNFNNRDIGTEPPVGPPRNGNLTMDLSE